MLFILCSHSCRKAGNNTCSGSFIAYDLYLQSGASGTVYALAGMNANTGNQVSGAVHDLEVRSPYLKGVYDVAENSYYVYAAQFNASTAYLYKLNFSGGDDAQFSTTIDSLSPVYLLCNSKTGKLYDVNGGWGGPTESIYEINTTGVFSEKRIYIADSGSIHSPVVDENSGYIFFVSWPYLKKVDPATGTASIVTTYSNVLPDQLQYDNNDGMFYGVNIYTQPYTFIRINPKNGAVTTIADLSYVSGNLDHTFDYCDNLYIVLGYTAGADWNTGWIVPSTGQLIKKTSVTADLGLTYINYVFK